MQKKGPAARAGGRRVGRPADLLKKKKKTTPATTATSKKSKKKGKDKNDDDDPKKARIKLVFKTIAIGSAASVILMAIVGIAMIALGYKLPNPKSVAHGAVNAALARITLENTAVALVAIAVLGVGIHLYRKRKARQAREKRLQQKRQLEAARKALQHDRKRQKIEMRKRRRELEEQDLVNKGKLIAELDELEKQREEEFEAEQQKLEEELRREAELERQIAAETRAHQYRVQALQQMQREEEMRREAVRKGKVVPGYDPSLDVYAEDGSDTDDGAESGDEDEDEEDNRAEVEVELNPAPRGFQLNMTTKLWWNIATLRAREINLRLMCNRCALPFDASLSGIYEANCSMAKRCSKCKAIQRVRFRPQLIHESSLCIGYVDAEDCQVQDITSVLFDSTCMTCSSSATFKSPAMRGRRVEVPCFQCHQKMALEIETLSFVHFTADGVKQRPPKPGAVQMAGKAGAAKRKKPLLKQGHVVRAGESLPNQGACKHFRKSYKWFRFPCCGLCFPCPVCHEQTNCDGAVDGTSASHVVCGKCSHEQAVGSKECSNCGFRLTQKNTTGHWAGGTGTRDTTKLSSKDRKKNQGVSRSGVKKTQSKKSQRVGQKGKANRNAKKKGGK